MALSSDALDIAIICSSKAKEFEGKDSRFEVIGSVITNSSVIIMRDSENKRIGVSSGRQYEKEMISNMLGNDYAPFAMDTRSLPYVMQSGNVGGVVIDYINSINIEGERIYPKKQDSFHSYSIIVRKEFIQNGKFEDFKDKYNKTITYLLEDNNMLREAEALLGGSYTNERRIQEWQKLNIKIPTL